MTRLPDRATPRIAIIVSFTGILLALATGCSQQGASAQWLKNGLLDPTQTGNFDKPVRLEIRDSVSVLDEPLGVQDAEEPTEEDLTVKFDEPKIGPGDFVKVTIFELVAPSVTTEQQFQVRATGYETFPVVGPVRIAGYTSRELELALKSNLREAGILEDADVQVTVLRYESQQYAIVGGVSQPGNYPLPRPSFRLLNALASAGGLPPQALSVIVIRDGSKLFDPTTQPETTQPAAPESPVSFTMSDTASTGVAGARQPTPATTSPAKQGGIDELEILEGAPREPGDDLAPVYNPQTGEWELKTPDPARREAIEPGATTRSIETSTSMAAPGDEHEWSEESLTSGVRVIEVPAKALREGDPRYNIVIRPSDLINVPVGEIGEFYMYGNISRPGAYELTGRKITVKQAIASAGGFGPLAWPSRADLIRRVGKDEEQFIQLDLDAIFAGSAPDFYLRPNDVVNIGSSPVSVFLAVVRNAFRFSYGFGFVYDRNFADSDSFGAKEQVKQRRRLEAQQRGLPF